MPAKKHKPERPRRGPTWCGNRLTIRQEELDCRILDSLATRMLRDDILAAFLEEYEAEVRRPETATVAQPPLAAIELAEVERQIAVIKTSILAGIDAPLFVTEIAALTKRRQHLAQEAASAPITPPPTLGRSHPPSRTTSANSTREGGAADRNLH